MEKHYYKIINDGIIVAVGEGYNEPQISKEEYSKILSTIKTAPIASDGFTYRLREDLTWELSAVTTDEVYEEAIDLESKNFVYEEVPNSV